VAKKQPSRSTKKKRKTRKDKGTSKVEVEVEVELEPAETKNLRLAAGIAYTQNFGVSLADMQRPDKFKGRFSGVSMPTLKRWSKEDDWVEGRRLYQEKFADAMIAQLGGEYLIAQSTQLKEFQEGYDLLRAKVVGFLSTEEFKVDNDNLVKYLNALTRMMQAQSSERLALAGHVIPQIPGAVDAAEDESQQGDLHPALVPAMSREEEIEYVQHMMRKRLQQSRQEMLESGELTHEDLHGAEVESKKKKRPPKKTVKK